MKTFLQTVTLVGGGQRCDLPELYSLNQNYLNSFTPATKSSCQLLVGSKPTFKIYDVPGNEVSTHVDEYRSVGKCEVEFPAVSLPGRDYFYRLNWRIYNTKNIILLL